MAIRDIVTPYFYSGQGRVLLSKRLADGAPEGYRDVGSVSQMDVVVTEKVIDHYDSQYHTAAKNKVHYLETSVNVSLEIESVTPENIAQFYDGSFEEIGSGVGYLKLATVIRGLSYGMDHIRISNLVVKNLAETVTFDLDTNYTVDAETGSVLIMDDQTGAANSIVNGSILKFFYDHEPQQQVLPFTGMREEYCLRFEGMNTAEGDTPIVLECFRVSQGMANQLAKISGMAVQTKVFFALLEDNFRPEGEQYFRELTVREN